MLQIWRTGVLCFTLFAGNQLAAALEVEVQSDCAILINSDNGKILYAKNAYEPMYPASCTKIAFALYAIKYHQDLFNTRITCSRNCLKTLPESQKSKNNFANFPSYVLESDASHMGLKVGEEMLFSDLLESTMVVSADDASNVIAEVMGEGSIEQCVKQVNSYLSSIGCAHTHFTNPHGLHHPEHVTTACDLALLCREAMKEPLFARMAKLTHFQRPKTNKQQSVYMKQTNRLLLKNNPFYYPFAEGGKTGYHRRAGHCLTAQAQKNGRTLIAVILHAKNKNERYEDIKKLFETAFAETMVTRHILPAGDQTFEKVIKDGNSPIKTETKDPIEYSFYPSEEPKVQLMLAWEKISLPVNKGALVGELQLLIDGKIEKKIPLFATQEVKQTLISTLLQYKIFIIFIVLGITVLATILFFRKKTSL